MVSYKEWKKRKNFTVVADRSFNRGWDAGRRDLLWTIFYILLLRD